MGSHGRNSRFLVICRIPDQGAFSHWIILRVSPVRPPFLLAHCAQLRILILGIWVSLESHDYFSSYGVTLIDPNFNPVFDLSGF